MLIVFEAQNAKVFSYKGGFVVDDYNKLKEFFTHRYNDRGYRVIRDFSVQFQEIRTKSNSIWITPIDEEADTDEESFIAIVMDTDNNGIFDTDVTRRTRTDYDKSEVLKQLN